MKLYATTTSERASKGQGGNEYLESTFTVEQMGKRLEVVQVKMVKRNGGYIISVSLPEHSSHVHMLDLNEHNNLYSLETQVNRGEGNLTTIKGKRQKGDTKTVINCKRHNKYVCEHCPEYDEVVLPNEEGNCSLCGKHTA